MQSVEGNPSAPGPRGTRLERLRDGFRQALTREPTEPQPFLRPASKLGFLVRLGVHCVALVVAIRTARPLFQPMSGRGPAPLPGDGGDSAYGVSLEIRRKIFDELAAAELLDRDRDLKLNTWKGHRWSQEDDRGWRERVLAKSIATRYGLSLSQVFLAFEEGIRKKWPAPNGAPLPATVPPLELRPE